MSDAVLEAIADYVVAPPSFSDEAYQTARLCLADALGCAILALQYPACTKLLGPVIPGTTVPRGSRVPGTTFEVDPIRAAFNFGTMIRWLDYNDTWLAVEWGHPSDNIGGLMMVADYLSRREPVTLQQLLESMIKAYEIQGILALENSFNSIGFDHVILVKVATAAVTAHLLGGGKEHVINAVSNALVDAGPLRLYRHAPNTGSRKSWAAGDATSRGVQFAWMAHQGEMGYHKALSAKRWGVNDVFFDGKELRLPRPFGSYVMENILFKISYPAEFHAQTAVEAAIALHPQVIDQLDAIRSIRIETQESAHRIIDKTGPLYNPADRDHCLQYMIAIALLKGTLTADDYEDSAAADPAIDRLREKMSVSVDARFSEDYLSANKRSIGNRITIELFDGTTIGPAVVEYPIGHRRRRAEAIPLLFDKLSNNLCTRYNAEKTEKLIATLHDPQIWGTMDVDRFIDLLI